MDHAGLSSAFLPGRATKDSEFFDENDYDTLLGPSGHPSIRDQEYLQHSTLYGHKFGGNWQKLNIKGEKLIMHIDDIRGCWKHRSLKR